MRKTNDTKRSCEQMPRYAAGGQQMGKARHTETHPTAGQKAGIGISGKRHRNAVDPEDLANAECRIQRPLDALAKRSRAKPHHARSARGLVNLDHLVEVRDRTENVDRRSIDINTDATNESVKKFGCAGAARTD